MPTCDVNVRGGTVYYDDTDDANAGRWCGCRQAAGLGYEWVYVDSLAACP
jgi:hypothetical protein